MKNRRYQYHMVYLSGVWDWTLGWRQQALYVRAIKWKRIQLQLALSGKISPSNHSFLRTRTSFWESLGFWADLDPFELGLNFLPPWLNYIKGRDIYQKVLPWLQYIVHSTLRQVLSTLGSRSLQKKSHYYTTRQELHTRQSSSHATNQNVLFTLNNKMYALK